MERPTIGCWSGCNRRGEIPHRGATHPDRVRPPQWAKRSGRDRLCPTLVRGGSLFVTGVTQRRMRARDVAPFPTRLPPTTSLVAAVSSSTARFSKPRIERAATVCVELNSGGGYYGVPAKGSERTGWRP